MSIFDISKGVWGFFRSFFTSWKENFEMHRSLSDSEKRINELQKDNRKLKQKLEFKSSLFFEDNACWIKKKDGTKEGPFCSACAEKYLSPIHLHKGQPGHWYCPVCNVGIYTKDYDPPNPGLARSPWKF